jgi:hypothetical protein
VQPRGPEPLGNFLLQTIPHSSFFISNKVLGFVYGRALT